MRGSGAGSFWGGTAGCLIGARFFAITDLWGVSRVAGSAPVGALGFVAD